MAARKIKNVAVGEMLISTSQDEVLYTCVGSCVAVTLYDQTNKIAGMLHIVLPGHRDEFRAGDRHAFYADTGIPLLIAEMENCGAVRTQIRASVVGGASLIADEKQTIGLNNATKVLFLLAKAGITVTREETGGNYGHTIQIEVKTGAIQIMETLSTRMVPLVESSQNQLSENFLIILSQDLAQLQVDPPVAQKLFDAIHEISIDWTSVLNILYQDFVLALHVLQMCNSSYYGLPGKIDSFETALSLFGADRFRRICVVAAAEKHNKRRLSEKGIDQRTLSRHCLASAITALHMATGEFPDKAPQVFTAAFFYPINKIAALFSDENKNSILDNSAMNDCLFFIKNDSEIACQHAHLGRILLTRWNIPSITIEAISPLKMPPKEKEELSLSKIVKVSCIISSMLGIPATKEKINLDFSLYALEQLEPDLYDDLLFAEIIIKLRAKGLLS